jgi:hypothetical protein
MHRWLLSACLGLAVAAAACGAPPSKEMDQAQGAIDAARAAGAEQYAATSYTAAVDALRRSEQAAAARDYRLALDNALTSREQAQNAAREAADSKAQLRGAAERDVAEIAALLLQARTRVEAARRTRVPQRTLRGLETDIAAVDDDVQKAGAAIEAGDYLAARPLLDGARTRIEQALVALDAQAASQSTRRRR